MLVKPAIPMLRYRRYRAFLVFAVFAIFGLFYSFGGDRSWQATTFAAPGLERLGLPSLTGNKADQSVTPGKQELPDLGGERKADSATQPPAAPAGVSGSSKEEDEGETPRKFGAVIDGKTQAQPSNAQTHDGLVDLAPEAMSAAASALASAATSASPSASLAIPEYHVVSSPVAISLGSKKSSSLAPPQPTGPAWSKQPEHFPVKSTIPLPTGPAKALPTIQFKFEKESEAAKQDRFDKLQQIRQVAGANWQSYKKYAWMHDELKPVSGETNNPFGGWAATLVDSLDTLYIMGFVKEFEEALKALQDIDFTRSLRDDIPLFETVIRYMGGMLGAYDVSGAKYAILLDKATELAEILMGAFDTPNRMPITMYQWRPEFASQPHRAGSNVVMAELGTLSLEFTRLAQLTGEAKYYDAIARITDAFEEWQTRKEDPSSLPGLFPLKVDASGCMKPDLFSNGAEWTQEIMASMGLEAPTGNTKPVTDSASDTEALLHQLLHPGAAASDVPVAPQSTKPKLFEDDATVFQKLADKKTAETEEDGKAFEAAAAAVSSVADDDFVATGQAGGSAAAKAAAKVKRQSETAVRAHHQRPAGFKPHDDPAAASVVADSGESTAASTASATSATASAGSVRSGTSVAEAGASTSQVLEQTGLSYLADEMEVCAPSNLTSGNKQGRDKFSLGGLADSTYEYFPKEYLLLGGLENKYKEMHERVVETATENLLFRPQVPGNPDILIAGDFDTWYDMDMDGSRSGMRSALMPDTHHLACFVGGMYALGAKIFERPQDLDIAAKLTEGCVWAYNVTATGIMPEAMSFMPCKSKTSCTWSEEAYGNFLDPETGFREDRYKQLLADYEKRLSAAQSGSMVPAYVAGRPTVQKRDAATPPGQPAPVVAEPPEQIARPQAPPSHAEVVQQLIKDQGLVAGMTHMAQSKYILRPEAIESVWYMYRITGNVHWREVGWNMFTAIEAATRGPYGNSAIADVTRKGSELLDSQESFFMAETLKYFYLLFSEEDVISLDEWVLNTEAHPFKRPTPGKRL